MSNDTTLPDPEEYHPAKNITAEEVARTLATFTEDEFEQVNRFNTGVDADPSRDMDVEDADRVLVSLDSQCADHVMHHAWSHDRDPGEILVAFVRFALIHQEECLGEMLGIGEFGD